MTVSRPAEQPIGELNIELEFKRQHDGSIEYEIYGTHWVGNRLSQAECGRTRGVLQTVDELRPLLLHGRLMAEYVSPWIYGHLCEIAASTEGPPPGVRLAGFLRPLMPRRRFEEVIEPILADAEREWVDAVLSNDRPRQRRTRLECTWHMLQATGLTTWLVRLLFWFLDRLR